ncbi:cytochrome P450 [Paenalcaligenes suwonensis]|uniref:cytochrome P450 n=1 Tax=Paenalcaligenes suwonensis TaxID=1202713 RepID=UPI00140BCB95|nr:cytochrome P450 [Paenalcaligenes suwonensis]NHC63140.1 cytochrome P450 [Paenalcaligenes suwonensis]
MLPHHSTCKTWPPGPKTGLTGWRLFRHMSKDMLATLSEWQQQYGDLVHLRVWPEHIVIVSAPTLARELLVTHHSHLTRWERGLRVLAQLHGNSVLISEGEQWAQKRRALQPYFTPKAIRNTNKRITDVAQHALSTWPESTAGWNIESAITSLTMDAIMQTMFSQGIGDDNKKTEIAVQIASQAANAEFFTMASWPRWLPSKKKKAIQQLTQLIDHQIENRLQTTPDNWPDDFLAHLLHLQQAEPDAWPHQAIRDECMTMFLAGHETTAATLTWWAWCMAANPTCQQKAQEEIARVLQDTTPTYDQLADLPYLTKTIEETMRLYPAAPVLMTRRAINPISLGPWQFPKRTLFMVPLQLIQGSIKWYSNPQKFCPERFGSDHKNTPRGAYAPFGIGPRVCLGQHLASAEIKTIAAMILLRWTLSVPTGMTPPKPALHVTLRPDQPLHLMLTSCGKR